MAVGPTRTVEQMELGLRELVATIQRPHLRRLLTAVFSEGSQTWALFRDIPAAKHYHHAYRHGLLDHSLAVGQTVSVISAVYGEIDRDVAVTGALLHDIGKLEAYAISDGHIEMTDAGKLHGEISLGYYRVRRAIEQIDDFPLQDEQALLHIILSHHGSLEHGSPVVPCTREATLVHVADNLGSKFGSFDRIEGNLDAGSLWASFDKGIGAFAYFGTGAERDAAIESERAAA